MYSFHRPTMSLIDSLLFFLLRKEYLFTNSNPCFFLLKKILKTVTFNLPSPPTLLPKAFYLPCPHAKMIKSFTTETLHIPVDTWVIYNYQGRNRYCISFQPYYGKLSRSLFLDTVTLFTGTEKEQAFKPDKVISVSRQHRSNLSTFISNEPFLLLQTIFPKMTSSLLG
ncbi:hypothetical protein CI610_02621 [invertebrate metagenome]|uniref:Uncharacterized protein n=1 Tax=invertebrate metagenome TaxID=1711999 RepID=A0A2H9T5D8_9ZZZZ